jgi:hypothetical protein
MTPDIDIAALVQLAANKILFMFNAALSPILPLAGVILGVGVAWRVLNRFLK